MTRVAVLVALLLAALTLACGSDSPATKTPSPPARTSTAIARTATPAVVPTIATIAPPPSTVLASTTPLCGRGCASATPTPAPIPTCEAPADCTKGTLEGLVLIGPTCPVQRIDSPCPDRPYEAEIAIVDAHGDIAATVRSGTDGRFVVELPPGDYVLQARAGTTFPTAPSPQPLTILAGATVSVTITYDSGIR
jgi:hypothetical protein